MAEINEIETKKKKYIYIYIYIYIYTQRINEIKTWFFEKVSKINKPLGNPTKFRREKYTN
jgi:hypothetical protein